MVNISKNLEEMGSSKRMSRSISREFIRPQIHYISDRVPQEEKKAFFLKVWVGFVMGLQ